jgi:hypothetical protein
MLSSLWSSALKFSTNLSYLQYVLHAQPSRPPRFGEEHKFLQICTISPLYLQTFSLETSSQTVSGLAYILPIEQETKFQTHTKICKIIFLRVYSLHS